ncbi:MAG: choice-of-anchor V domain-containing protein [Bacteroidota bacterium]|nr:choice-of-anchor V domain-containing protein [Bacteroidota bacterium]
MKRNLFLVGAVIVAFTVLESNSAGVALIQTENRTGELGEGSSCNQPYCHGGGDFGTSVQIEVTHPDSTGAVSAYAPGTEYMLNIIVNTSNGDAPRFGMQSTAVDANGENAGSFNNPSSNAQLGSVNDRHIFEHSGASSTNTFSVNWTSPSEGGNVTFYAAGLAAGNPTSPQGDEHNLAQLVLPAGEPVVTHVDEVAWTAPTNWNGQTWQWQAPSSGRLVVADVSGRVLVARNLAQGQNVEWNAGGLRLVDFVTEEGTRKSWKLAAR